MTAALPVFSPAYVCPHVQVLPGSVEPLDISAATQDTHAAAEPSTSSRDDEEEQPPINVTFEDDDDDGDGQEESAAGWGDGAVDAIIQGREDGGPSDPCMGPAEAAGQVRSVRLAV